MKRPASSSWPDQFAAMETADEVKERVEMKDRLHRDMPQFVPALTDEERQAARLRWMELSR